jgi:hypothetical protein
VIIVSQEPCITVHWSLAADMHVAQVWEVAKALSSW